MPNYPITDPAEIAKLPPAVYETGLGAMCLSDDGVWTDFAGDRWSHTDLASSGGIAARLVPERVPDSADLTCDRCSRRMAASVKGDNGWEQYCERHYAEAYPQTTAEAQRDRALEMLRQAKAEAGKHTGSGVPGDEPYCCCALCELVGDIGLEAFLAEQETNDE